MIAGALFYYQFHSWRNRLLTRIRRLRQPKYLAGAIVGGIYFYFYLFRGLRGDTGRPGNHATSSGDERLAANAGGAGVHVHDFDGVDSAPLAGGPGVYRSRDCLPLSGTHQPKNIDPFQTAEIADGHFVQCAVDDFDRARLGRRPSAHSCVGMVGGVLRFEPSRAGQLLRPDHADGSRDFNLETACAHSWHGVDGCG
jgi:hypothetical protein